MQLRWINHSTQSIGVAFVTDDDAKVLQAVGYYHCCEEDFTDDELDEEYIEVWKPKRTIQN